MEYSEKDSSYLIQACSLANYTAPHPSHISTQYPLECEYWVDSRYWTSSSWADYYQYSVLSDGDYCDPYGIVSVCDSTKNLVCYCPYDICYCTKGLVYGDECDDTTVPCISGFVCSNKVCTKKYSIPAGIEATDSLACEGGGPLVISNDVFVCRQGPQTLGGIPKACSTDNDCISDTGSETTQCVCGLNTDGQGYCSLHFSDSPMVSWREAERDGDYKLEIYWKFTSVNYPYLQGNVAACLGDVWRDYYQYKLGEPHSSLSGLSANRLYGIVFMMILCFN